MSEHLTTTPVDHVRATRYALALVAAHRGDPLPFVAITEELAEQPEERRIARTMNALAEIALGIIGQVNGYENVEDELRQALAVTQAAADQQAAAQADEGGDDARA
ncbi:hypothetical protein [Rhodococcus koreensis]|uniref:hypothetical protein n=1 Tax=Rhodococcus koreensis TaxID=99653 RepID=UPI00197D085A|nr:hypothetical protein [Rhodococcus koreensis]QSE84081.1 hypothetical protein JWS14_35530 [Rhodococcus koreensis]